MALTDQQKLDIVLKKVAFTATKTGSVKGTGNVTGVGKDPNEEAVGSPLVVPNNSIWSQSDQIPASAPAASTAYVQVYGASSPLRMTKDSTITGNRTWFATTTYGTESSRVGDWIDPGNFGATYLAKIYVGPLVSGSVNAANLLNIAGSGNNDSWYFDYAAGVLNFGDTNVPTAIGANDLYLVAYRYIGTKGAAASGSGVGIGSTSSINTTGIITATKFVGDGSGLTGVIGYSSPGSGVIVKDDGSTVGTAGTIDFGSNLTVTLANGIATVTASGGGSALTVSERPGIAGADTNITNNVSALRFDSNSGFNVTSLGGGEVFVDLGSTFNPWYVAGQDTLKADGEEPIEIVAGPGIAITTKAVASVGIGTTFSKAITISATGGGGSSQWVTIATGISTTSNVGIGTTSSTGFKLDIFGDTRIQSTGRLHFGGAGVSTVTNFSIRYNSMTNSLDFIAGNP